MADFGIKIAKQGGSVLSEEVDDYVFTSKYQSLMFLKKVEHTVTTSSGSYEGTGTYTHGYGYPLLVIGFYNGYYADYMIPFDETGPVPSPPHPIAEAYDNIFYEEGLDMRIKENTIDFVWSTYGSDGGGTFPDPPVEDREFATTLYFYNIELGQSTV
jgi:hypothetical protein